MSEKLPAKIKKVLLLEDLELNPEIVDDQNPPVFYDPGKVIRLSEKLKQFSFLALIIINLLSLSQIGQLQRSMRVFLREANFLVLSWILTAVLGSILILIQSFINFFGLRAMAWLLLILMEMEFTSRNSPKIASAQPGINSAIPVDAPDHNDLSIKQQLQKAF